MKSLLLLSLASAVSASSTHVPLVRRARSGIITPEELAAQRDGLDSKYGRLGGAGKVRPRQSNSVTPMVNQNADTSYYGIMNVGTPPAPYGVALGKLIIAGPNDQQANPAHYVLKDTGSSDLWFQSSTCAGCTEGIKLQATSSSLKETGLPFEIKYGSGAVGGMIASDTVEMGGFTVPDQVMGLVNQTSGVLLTGQTAGLLGLAFKVRTSHSVAGIF
jgi:cathepsin D